MKPSLNLLVLLQKDLEVKYERSIRGTSLSPSRNRKFLEKVYSFLSLVGHYLEYKQMVTKTGKFCKSCVPS